MNVTEFRKKLNIPIQGQGRCIVCSQIVFLGGIFEILQDVCFFNSTPLWFIVFQMESYVSGAPLLLTDGWIRGDQKGGDTERVSAAFSFSLFSTHSASKRFPVTAWLALDSLFLSASLGHYTLISCSVLLSLYLFSVMLSFWSLCRSLSLPLFAVHHFIHPSLPFFFNPEFCTALTPRISF